MRQSHIKINRFRGLFHDQKIKVLSSITSRRLEGLRVSYMWITCKMMEQVKKDQPLLYVMNPNTLGRLITHPSLITPPLDKEHFSFSNVD